MKNIVLKVLAFHLIAIFSFQLNAQETECQSTVEFGAKEICLPEIDSLTECYYHSKVKAMADATEISMNSVLGFYLDNSTFAQVERLGEFAFDNYIKVYATNDLAETFMDTTQMKFMQEMVGASFVTETWDLLKEEIDQLDLPIELGKPTTVEGYQHTEDSFTYVMMMKYQVAPEEYYTMCFTMNGLILNERLIWMAYYLDYQNQDDLSILKQRSNKALEKILEANK